ncbi:phenylalanine--tRNA ligase subunit beta [Pelodictyon luteolum]|uniref:Phenylalanine--tRNA ligase beta subunit n=1 Tax=Chlorobium luteolum (strain DSM 273 / BCRC 81028 / 2530) TaxID=319225 RepID=SYFB_CHLL3|nr:phenylalanine--tRNA ligase subunit beta [Pelodictyon luteolum]Q3B4Z2.1 RecName: Full=Phenylalanine--tRNA ligase beta subunit; AltName: Full=Phenylalanyl-tRNA synthetase beta subunit; Short=PheRS [Pelodictyon luteolum DSM 273]ABB23589.1 phenylalanyl-tRNA synthetase beta subunit [Pelodictyon luteolum DSM 273]
MKISVNWLKDFLPSFSPDITSLVEKLTFLGLEVEDVESTPLPDLRVVVGRVQSVALHPDADRLRICMVDTGLEEPLQIVCGAPNVAEGMLVPVATEGSRLTMQDGTSFVIKPSKIRGQRSFGMICAADELGLSADHSGVMELDSSYAVGEPFARYLDSDTVLDIAVTPNRPDVLSHLGIARELGSAPDAILFPEEAPLEFSADSPLVQVMDSGACPLYVGVIIRGVTVGPSPRWLSARLESIGLRPKNNIVDITNFILHALGQPLHAFDLQKLKGGRVIVRSDFSGSFTTLGAEQCTVEPGMPVICDTQMPVALAGVMGGLDSAVGEGTVDILLEAACFAPSAVRRSARKAGISSDSSYRFERGIDIRNVLPAARAAVALILETAGGTVGEATLQGDPSPALLVLPFRPRRANELLGTAIETDAMQAMLARIGFRTLALDEGVMQVEVPSCRIDVLQEIDLIEEVARLHGYDNIEASGRLAATYPASRTRPGYFPDFLRGVAVGLDFREVLTNPLIRREEAAPFGDGLVSVLNPISEGLEVLRPGLVPGMLKVIAHNIRHGNRDMRLFEVAHGFSVADPSGAAEQGPLGAYCEKEWLVLALTGNRYPRSWNQPPDRVDFYDAVGAAEMLLGKLNLLDKSAVNIYNENTVSIDLELTEGKKKRSQRAGRAMRLDSALLSQFGIEQDVFTVELDVSVLEMLYSPDVVYDPPSKFPAVQRDLSFILPGTVPVQSLVGLVRSSDPLIRDVSVFDVFERGSGGGGERSVGLSISIADHSGTLQEGRISEILRTVGVNAESKLGAVIRQV